ncbi:gustatory and odorant receptor 24-like isoform X2 [Zootermopsis nevadensis]|nr:gustatory and odorant receptor 24-like isoform X2 [Zootermopsis nevadensis]
MLYSAAVVGLVTAGTLFMVNDRFWRVVDQNSSFGDKVLETANIIFFLPVILVPFTHWFECGKKARFVNSWRRMQTNFRDVTGKPLSLDLTRAIRKVKASVAVIVTVLTTLLFVMQRGFTWWQGLCFAYCVCLSVITTGTWGTMGRALELAAERVITELQLCVRVRMYHCADHVRRFKSLWVKLSLLTQEFGTSLGYSYACNLLVFFVQQVLAVYGILSEMGRGFDVVNSTFAVSAIMFTYAIFVICDAGQLATEQVGEAFQIKLQTLCDEFPHSWSETRYEITLFLQAIATNSPKITFCRFVEVNRGLIASLMAAMVTYLVVLMQFQMSWKQPCAQVCIANLSATCS